MILLINTIQPNREFISDVIDDNVLPEDIRELFNSLPNGFTMTNNEYGDWYEETDFDICHYTDGSKIPSALLTSDAKIDKIINMEY
jgi:hypothetical protein